MNILEPSWNCGCPCNASQKQMETNQVRQPKYYKYVINKTGGNYGDLDAVVTSGRFQTNDVIHVRIGGENFNTWMWMDGPADINEPGAVAPLDYNAETNNHHWLHVDGYLPS